MPRPNIILLQAEDTGRHQRCYGDPFAQTPNLDRLAAQGCRFTHAFSTAGVCAPSRSTMVMGRHSNREGSHHMRSTLIAPPRLFTHRLREAGYHVNWANKTDFNFEPPNDFADQRSDWRAALDEAGHPPVPHAGDPLPDGPFFLYFNFNMTHESGMWPREAGADPDLDYDAHAEEPGVDPALLEGVPVPPYLQDTPTLRAALYRYYRQLRRQDQQIGRILYVLDVSGLAENTVVIYLADHGRGQNREKRWLYDAGTHLPLIIRAPGLTTPGSVREDLVSWVDIAPTIHALAGVPLPEGDEAYDGRVLLTPGDDRAPADAAPAPAVGPEPDYVFAARDRMDECFDRCRSARSRRYRYIRNDFPQLPWAQRLKYMETMPAVREMRDLHARGELRGPEALFMQPTKPEEELYDSVADPHNVHNLADEPAYADVLTAHREAVRAWSQRIGDKGMVREQALIDAGVITDRLNTEYAARITQLPDRLRGGGVYDPVLTEDEALARRG